MIKSWVPENSTTGLFTKGSYIHSYRLKIFVHNSQQNNGTVLFIVKILAARVWQAFDSVLSIYTSNAIWKIPWSFLQYL